MVSTIGIFTHTYFPQIEAAY